MPAAELRLECERDVERRDGRFVATGVEPWLSISGLDLGRVSGGFVELTYRLGLWDAPARPVLRVHLRDGGRIDHICPGPVLGAATWTGRLPADASRLSISPTNRLGAFDFRIERARTRRWLALLAEGLGRNAKSTRSAILTRLIGWRPESDSNLAWAIGATPLRRFAAWRRRHSRCPDLAGMDRPRFDWATAPVVIVIVRAAAATDPQVERTCASLRAQVFDGWRAVLVGTSFAASDPRIVVADDVPTGFRDGTIVGTVDAGDVLPPTALACLVEQAHRHPNAKLLYGDTVVAEAGGLSRPRFVPGWSPRLAAARRDVEMAAFRRNQPADGVGQLGREEVVALSRILVERASASPPPGRPATRPVPPRTASASVIIPTKDHPALLSRVLASIRARTAGAVEVIVVDNASTGDEARRLLATLRDEPGTVVVDYPGAFNFSAICNAAAGIARGDVLVFLNDDTEVLVDDWLDRLCAHAGDPAVGAVGAKLTYPDGRLQHVGVLLGMGGSAGHFGAPAPGGDPGWAGRNLVAHEVSAVTGACLAVAREKFEAVGGFDAEHLPIELSDIDLCLKLDARGWQTVTDPAVHLLHEESASRGGATLRRLTVHGAERAIFMERWRHVIRDDPFFHPGLSLYSWREALG